MGKCHDLQHYLPGKIYKKPEILQCLQNRKPGNVTNSGNINTGKYIEKLRFYSVCRTRKI